MKLTWKCFSEEKMNTYTARPFANVFHIKVAMYFPVISYYIIDEYDDDTFLKFLQTINWKTFPLENDVQIQCI